MKSIRINFRRLVMLLLTFAGFSRLMIIFAQSSVSDIPFNFVANLNYVYPDQDFNIVQSGASPDNEKKTTTAIAKAISACNKAGGGRVIIPAGEWITSTIHSTCGSDLMGGYSGDGTIAPVLVSL